MKDHKLKGMGCEFDDLIADTAKVYEITGNSMSERQAAMESAQWLDDCAEGMEEEGLDRENNARHFRTGAKYIRDALSAPAVPVIEGLDAIVERIYDAVRLADKEYDGIHEGTIGTTRKEYTKKAISDALAALPKLQKVDLNNLKRDMRNPVQQGGKSNDWYQNGYDVGYNAAIDDIKSKYGELYAEVK